MPKGEGYKGAKPKHAPEDANSGGVPTKGMSVKKKTSKTDGPANRPHGR